MPLETQYQTLLDNLNTSVLLVDEWLAISYANPAAEALLKIGLVKLRGTQVCALFTDVVGVATRDARVIKNQSSLY